MVNLKAESVTIGNKGFNSTKAGYPAFPTVYSGIEINFGADSCLEHPEASTATLSLWVPKTHESFIPKLGDEVKITASIGASSKAGVFTGSVDEVKLWDNRKSLTGFDPEPFRGPTVFNTVSAVAADWQLSYNYSKTETRAVPSANKAVGADGTLTVTLPDDAVTDSSGSFLVTGECTKRFVMPSNADISVDIQSSDFETEQFRISSYNAAVSGTLVNSTEYMALSDIRILHTATGTYWGKMGSISLHSKSRTFSIGPLVVRNRSLATKDDPKDFPGWRVNISASDAVAAAGRLRLGDVPWPSEGGMARLSRIATLANPSGVEFFDPGYTLADGVYTMPENSGEDVMANVLVRARDVDSVNALEVYQNTAMSAGLTVGSVDNKVTTNNALLLPQVLNKSVSAAYVEELTSEYTGRPVPVIPSDAIVDSSFTLDATETVNQVKIEYFVREGSLWTSEYLAVSEQTMTKDALKDSFSTPVARTLSTENQVNTPFSPAPPNMLDTVNAVWVRAKAALSAQSVPHWKLTESLSIILRELPDSAGLLDLIEESGRFGQLIRIDGVPEQIGRYQRIRGGRILFAENPELEFEIEPVDYSGPTPLSKNTAYADTITRTVKVRDMKTISAKDLRSIGAR